MSPRVSEILKTGMTVTVEPGVYIPGKSGVRIEDLTVITPTGYERLSHSTKVFLSIG
jgi:Xaa-Pro aminopeptidase